MSDDDLTWRPGARTPGADYRVFRTELVDATHPRIGTKRFSRIDAGDWVNVIALTPADEVVLIRQYRIGIEKVCLEIPGGMVDPGEDARTAAARELAEETGYTSPTWKKLGTVAPNPAIQNNYLHTYLALDAQRTEDQRLDGSEVVTVHTVPLREVTEILRRGEIEHALVVTAFAHLAWHLTDLRRP
jgi:8-oxo-dGTP pyrophosphatase MutT (NUDIX family)